MSDSDKMRAEFEAEARVIGLSLFPMKGKGEYWNDETNLLWRVCQAAYAAGQKAEQVEVERLRAELAEVRAELEKIVGETIKRNGWGDAD